MNKDAKSPPSQDAGPKDDTKGKTNTIHLSGPEKAAIIFLCLQEDLGSDLMQHLEEAEIQAITRAMATLGTIPSEAVEMVITEFTTNVAGGVAGGVVGNLDSARRLLSGFMSQGKVDEIMAHIEAPDAGQSIWESFSALNEQTIVTHLRGEHDQTIAAVLSKVRPDVAARVLPHFGEDRMVEIARRMIGLDSLPRVLIEEIETAIKDEVLSSAARRTGPDPLQRMADMFNRMDPDDFDRLSNHLEQHDPVALAAIREKMFTFDDLVKLDVPSLQRIVRGCDGKTLPLALRGAKKNVRSAFMNAMTQRAREALDEEMKTMGSVRMRDVREAQGKVIDVANELAQQNIIRIPLDDDEMV